MSRSTYLIALGSNRRHVRHGGPDAVVRAAVRAMAKKGMKLKRLSGIHRTRALGPAGRDFANAAALVKSHLGPPELLRKLKKIERKRSEEHTSEPQSLIRSSYAVFCLKKKKL